MATPQTPITRKSTSSPACSTAGCPIPLWLTLLLVAFAVILGASLWAGEEQRTENLSLNSGLSPSPVALETQEESAAQDPVVWSTNLDGALTRAKETGKPVLIDFAAPWCPPCVMMDRHVWPDSSVQTMLKDQVIPVRVEIDSTSTPDAALKYSVKYLPTVLLVDPQGQEIERVGYVGAEELIALVDRHKATK
ncbi:thioredoxin family protein [Rubinisphaera margarita]|uniref:thioredoxin family protein n=1 Tax=Rubinisphaera margarita TaxID=2909586 RepID=UPI001EE845BC|nr:thioredoxin family protein [Rubinisphaera margarita]MCG6155872.1 thioredoxin family protein [Rubinisphaera margarita]